MPLLYKSSSQPQKTPSPKNSSPIQPAQLSHKSEYLGAYQLKPERVHFATQGQSEEILLFIRQHPITQIPWIFIAFVISVAPLFFLNFVAGLLAEIGIPYLYMIVILTFWYLITFSFIFSNFLLWYFNVNIITTQRVLDIDFPSLLIQEVNGTRIENIEQVTYKAVGVLSTLFDNGNVFVETAGAEVNIEFLGVPHPKQIVKLLLEIMHKGDSHE